MADADMSKASDAANENGKERSGSKARDASRSRSPARKPRREGNDVTDESAAVTSGAGDDSKPGQGQEQEQNAEKAAKVAEGANDDDGSVGATASGDEGKKDGKTKDDKGDKDDHDKEHRSRHRRRHRHRDRSRSPRRSSRSHRDRDRSWDRHDRERDHDRRRDRDRDRHSSRRDSSRRDRDRRRRSRSRSPRRRRHRSRSRSYERSSRHRSSRRRHSRRSSSRSSSRSRSGSGSRHKKHDKKSSKEEAARPAGVSVADVLAGVRQVAAPGSAPLAGIMPGMMMPGMVPSNMAAGSLRMPNHMPNMLYNQQAAGVPGMSRAFIQGVTATADMQALMAKVQQQAVAARAAAPTDMSTKLQRELYMGNIPPANAAQLKEMIGQLAVSMGLNTQPGNPVVNVITSSDGHYCFTEFRSIAETDNALALNGTLLLGQPLKIGRPKGYVAPSNPAPPAAIAAGGAGAAGAAGGAAASLMPGAGVPPVPATTGGGLLVPPPSLAHAIASATAAATAAAAGASAAVDTSVTVLINNIPPFLNQEAVEQIASPFGVVLKTELQTNPDGSSKGSAMLKFADAGAANKAIQGLNGLKIGDNLLIVQRAPTGMTMSSGSAAPAPHGTPSQVVMLGNMVTDEDLSSAENLKELAEETTDECNTYGMVVSVEVPRKGTPGEGKIFVHMDSVASATRASDALRNRKFDGRTVEATFYPLDKFTAKDFQVDA